MSKGCLRENQIRRHVSPVSENPQLAVKAAGRFSRMECSCVSIQLDVPPEMKPGPGTHSISCFQHSGGGIALGPEETLSYPAGNGKHNTADVIQEVPREILWYPSLAFRPRLACQSLILLFIRPALQDVFVLKHSCFGLVMASAFFKKIFFPLETSKRKEKQSGFLFRHFVYPCTSPLGSNCALTFGGMFWGYTTQM